MGLQALGLAHQPGIFGGLRIGLTAPLRGRQALQFTALALVAPSRQVRRVQPFPAQQRAHFAALGAGIRFLQDAVLILRRETPPLRFHDDFGVRHSQDNLTIAELVIDSSVRHAC